MKISKNFDLRELVSPYMWERFGESSQYFLSNDLIMGIQQIRNFLCTPIVVNDWHFGGKFKYSGLREFDCLIGAEFSRHKYGLAVDLKFPEMNLHNAREQIYRHYQNFGITEIEAEENTKTWIHLGFGGDGRFREVKP